MTDVPEAFRGRDLDQHARRLVGASPHHAGIGRHVAGLNAMGDQRAIGSAAEVWPRNSADRRNGGCGSCGFEKSTARRKQYLAGGHRELLQLSNFHEIFGSTIMRQYCRFVWAAPIGVMVRSPDERPSSARLRAQKGERPSSRAM